MKWSAAFVTLLPPTVVAVTSTVPAVPAGATAVIDVALFTVKLVAAVTPNVTAVAFDKPVPVIVIVVPAVSGPDAGLIPVTVGAATGVTEFEAAEAILVPAEFVAATVNVYAVPFSSPATVQGEVAQIPTLPPGDDVAV